MGSHGGGMMGRPGMLGNNMGAVGATPTSIPHPRMTMAAGAMGLVVQIVQVMHTVWQGGYEVMGMGFATYHTFNGVKAVAPSVAGVAKRHYRRALLGLLVIVTGYALRGLWLKGKLFGKS